jgi:hypothetical protein
LRFNSSGDDALAWRIRRRHLSQVANSYATVWYPFVGNSFTLYGFSRANVTSARVYVDDN